MTSEILRKRIPLFATATSLEIALLVGVISLNNTNYKVLADGKEYVLRIGTESAHYLGIPVGTLASWVRGGEYPTTKGIKHYKPIIKLQIGRASCRERV